VSALGPDRELAGHLDVAASARRIRHYRYAEERMMRMLAGWIALTPELPAKLLLGRQVWDCAQHADLWGRRLPELRAPAHVSEPASQAFVRFMDVLENREQWGETIERLTGVYRVLKPHLADTYALHLAQTNPVYEPPTRRILERCLTEERRHITEATSILEALVGAASAEDRAAGWERELRALLGQAGGVAGPADR
jgi:1,2-phenylacetyl-CoA epoxidase catalytic subunit